MLDKVNVQEKTRGWTGTTTVMVERLEWIVEKNHSLVVMWCCPREGGRTLPRRPSDTTQKDQSIIPFPTFVKGIIGLAEVVP